MGQFRTRMLRLRRALVAFAAYVAIAALFVGLSGDLGARDWRTASREPAGLAPDPATTREAVVQVYAARTVGWRGYFAVHTWIAVKRSNADRFTVYEVMGFRIRRGQGGSAVFARDRAADGYWYGARPDLLSDVRGSGVDALIDRIEAAVASYPYANEYEAWPGPNSNTFVAHVLRAVPELNVDLPSTAIGKDYLEPLFVERTPTGTGGQLNLYGVAGVLAGFEEGVEINVIGLTLGVNPKRLSLKLPLIGTIGPGGDAAARRFEPGGGANAPSPTN